MVVGENGVLNRATDASVKTKSADRKERADLDKMAELIDEIVSGSNTVEQVIDEHPGMLEEKGSEKVINSIEDLIYFADSVEKGTTYEGETVKLGLSLDFNSSKSYVDPYRTDYEKYGYSGELKTMLTSGEGFKPIAENFKGIFDGNYFKLYNLLICENIEQKDKNISIGMFLLNRGTIQNLGLEYINFNYKIFSTYPSIGGITGINFGTINNCYVKGNIECEASGISVSVGMLAGYNYGKIENSFVDGNLNFDGKSMESSCSLRIRGIVGMNELNESTLGVAIIRNVYNIGNISITNTENLLASESFYFGGICGWNLKGTISSSYSIAKLSTTMYYAVCWIGGVVGREQGQTKDNDNYYLENILLGCRVGDNWTKDFLDKSEELNSSNMKTSNFVTLLNNGQDIWVEDKNNINDGYPILNWQVEN